MATNPYKKNGQQFRIFLIRLPTWFDIQYFSHNPDTVLELLDKSRHKEHQTYGTGTHLASY